MTISLILTGGTICCRTDADGLRRSDVSQAQTRLESGYFAQHPASGVAGKHRELRVLGVHQPDRRADDPLKRDQHRDQRV